MGRFPASGARLHEPRQPKPANAAFRQGRAPRSHGSSLGPEHPQRAIPPACREAPAFGRYRTASRAPSAAGAGAASASPNPPRRPRGALPASSPWNPTGRMPAQAPRGCCPGRAAARRTRDIPTEFRAASARRRQFGGDAGPRGPSRIRRSAPPPGHIGRQAEQGGLASAADRGNPGKGPAEAFARTEGSRRQIAASMPHARSSTCPKGPENGLRAGSCADASAQSAMRHRKGAAGKEAGMYANPKETTSLRMDPSTAASRRAAGPR